MSSLSSQYSVPYVRRSSRDSNQGHNTPNRAENSARMPINMRQLTPVQRLQVYEKVLESKLPFLCGHLDPSRHYAYLRSKSFFDRTTVETIESHVTTDAKVRCFVDELLRRGPSAVSAFIESLEKNKVEQFVFSVIADQLQAFRIEDLHPSASNHNHDSDHQNFDIGDDAVCDDERRLSDGFHSLSVSENASVIDGNDPVFPPIDIKRLREAEGLHLPEDERGDPEECSDISSLDGFTSHTP